MVILTCPNCGDRNVSEYRYGGEYNPRPANPLDTDDVAWADYIFMKANKLGIQKEWWYHTFGCGTWFLAERQTYSNSVEKTYFWTPSESENEGS